MSKVETWLSLGTGLAMTAAGLAFDLWWLILGAAGCYAVGLILWIRRRETKKVKPGEMADDKEGVRSRAIRIEGGTKNVRIGAVVTHNIDEAVSLGTCEDIGIGRVVSTRDQDRDS